MMTSLLFLFLLMSGFTESIEQDDSDRVWILIDHANLKTCSGSPNQFALTKDDVSVKDSHGNAVTWIEAPGEYFIEFTKIRVAKVLPNLSGRLGVTLQVPIVSAGPLHLDFPYQVIPQKTILEGTKCDDESGAIIDSHDKRAYCRYCDLCSTSAHVERQLSSGSLGSVYTPKVGLGPEGSFSRVCQKINATTYSLKRTLVLPGKRELEGEINSNYQGAVEGVIQQKFKIGKGKLQVFLNLDSSTNPPVDSRKWYANNGACACCIKDDFGHSKCRASLVEIFFSKKSSTCAKCYNQYVKNCLQGQNERVGCFMVEYNFHITDRRADFEAFKNRLPPVDHSRSKSSNGIVLSGDSGIITRRPPAPHSASMCPRAGGFCDNFHTFQDQLRRRFCCNLCPQLCAG